MKQKEIFIISVGILMTIVAWVVGSIYHSTATTKIKTDVEKVQPIEYKINTDFFKVLKEKTP